MNYLMGIALAATSVVPGAGADAGADVTNEPPVACTQIATPSGVGLTVAETDTENVDAAVLTANWAGADHRVHVELTPDTEPVPDPVSLSAELSSLIGLDDSRSAPVVETGELVGFADVEDLPTEQVTVTVDLLDDAGDVVFTDATVVTPELTYPNGPNCPPSGTQADVRVEDGQLS